MRQTTTILRTALRNDLGVSYVHPGVGWSVLKVLVAISGGVSNVGTRRERGAQLAREVIPSLGNARYKCVLMVRWERYSRWPISRFDRPCAAS